MNSLSTVNSITYPTDPRPTRADITRISSLSCASVVHARIPLAVRATNRARNVLYCRRGRRTSEGRVAGLSFTCHLVDPPRGWAHRLVRLCFPVCTTSAVNSREGASAGGELTFPIERLHGNGSANPRTFVAPLLRGGALTSCYYYSRPWNDFNRITKRFDKARLALQTTRDAFAARVYRATFQEEKPRAAVRRFIRETS